MECNNSVGTRPAFSSESNYHGFTNYGMTYRQWLIGQALSGVIANLLPDEMMDEKNIANTAITIADYIVERLDNERSNNAKQ